MPTPIVSTLPTAFITLILCANAFAQVRSNPQVQPVTSGVPQIAQETLPSSLVQIPRLEGVQFINGSSSQLLLEKNGKRYLIDTQNQTIREVLPQAVHLAQAGPEAASSAPVQTAAKPVTKREPETYYTEDLVLWTLPTSYHLGKKALMIDFTHRFAFSEPFEPGGVSNLLGLDGFSISAFGLTYGVTDRFFVGAYRTPTNFGRIIQLQAGAELLHESKGHPISSTFRVGVEGTDHFRTKYITSVELAFARSIKQRAQLYFVPTVSFNNRPMNVVAADVFNPTPFEGKTTTALGAGISVDIRPTVALLAEVIQRTSGRLGVHRPAFMLGIQKKVFRHSFTLGLTNSPGTTFSTRSATRADLGFDDTFGGLTIGFNLSRRLF